MQGKSKHENLCRAEIRNEYTLGSCMDSLVKGSISYIALFEARNAFETRVRTRKFFSRGVFSRTGAYVRDLKNLFNFVIQ